MIPTFLQMLSILIKVLTFKIHIIKKKLIIYNIKNSSLLVIRFMIKVNKNTK